MDKKVALFSILLSGCTMLPAVGPEYAPPQLPETSQWSVSETSQRLFVEPAEAVSLWWKRMQDPELSRLIELGLSSNLSYQSVQSRVRESRAARGLSGASFLPSIDGSYGLERSGRSESNPIGGFGKNPLSLYRAGFDARWEIDILGGDRRAFEAAIAEEEGALAHYENSGITLVSDIAISYIRYRELEERVRVLEKSVAAMAQSQQLAKVKFDSGMTSELDYAQSTAQLENTRAQLPLLKQLLTTQRFAIAILCGKEPISFVISSDTGSKLPELSQFVGLLQPTELLRQRPDIIAVERRLAAQTARIGVAMSDLFPKFSIGASLGVQSTKSGSLFEDGNRFWSFGPNMTLPIFHGGSILNNIEIQNERAKQALFDYQETVLHAIKEVQDSLNSYSAQKQRVESLKLAFQAAERSLNLSKDLYEQGMIDFLRVLEAERTALNAEDALIQAKAAYGESAISVYKAFAGTTELKS